MPSSAWAATPRSVPERPVFHKGWCSLEAEVVQRQLGRNVVTFSRCSRKYTAGVHKLDQTAKV